MVDEDLAHALMGGLIGYGIEERFTVTNPISSIVRFIYLISVQPMAKINMSLGKLKKARQFKGRESSKKYEASLHDYCKTKPQVKRS